MMREQRAIGILGIGTALPPFSAKQTDLLRALHPRLEPGSARERLARSLFRNARIDERRFCIPDLGGDAPPVLYRDADPTTRERMQVYQREAPRLAAAACERALKSARLEPREITHLVVVTCTGIFTPGPDVELVSLLSLRPVVERTLVGFMGCSGAFHGLRVARRAAADSPDARVLLVCVELCSIHRRRNLDPASLVAHSIFADGAAGVVLGATGESGTCLLELGEAITHLEPNTRDALTWEIRDDGFEVRLSRELPAIIAGTVAGFVAPLLDPPPSRAKLAWVAHPGGAAILGALEAALELDGGDLETAYSVLRRLGNTSSSAILYVLEESLPGLEAGREGILLGFGPGLTLEAVRFRRGSRRL